MKKKNKKTYAEKCGDLLDSSLEGAKKLDGLGKLSEALGGVIGNALSDSKQFNRYIVTEKGKNSDGDPVQQDVEKIFDKVDFKSVKDAASAISAVAESIKTVYSVPETKDIVSVVSGSPSPVAAGITVSFESGAEWGE